VIEELEQGVFHIKTPVSDKDVEVLRAGDRAILDGTIYTARDEAHRRLADLLRNSGDLPFELEGQVIYYVGPTPARPGRPIGSAGPTTSYRMDPYTPELIAHGLKGMIGKGKRSSAVKNAIKKYKAIYFAALGGAGALISRSILSARVIAFPELGPEAIYQMEVKEMRLMVINDIYGGDLYIDSLQKYRR